MSDCQTEQKTTIEALQADMNALRVENKRLEALVAYYAEQLRLSKAKCFGASSEKSKQELNDGCEQLSIFNEAEQLAELEAKARETESETEEISAHKRRIRKALTENDEFAHLPVERVVLELSEEERICPVCGEQMNECGQEVKHRELKFIPAQFRIIEYAQTAYICRRCDREQTHTPIKKADAPNALLPGSGIVSPGLLAYIAWQKYGLGIPLYRLEQELGRMGIPLSRQTMANWIIRSYEQYLADVQKKLEKELKRNDILHADETSVQVLREDGRRAESKSYMWLRMTSESVKNQIVLFEYAATRGKIVPEKMLTDYKGYLHTDGYDVYHSLPNVINVGCWAHMRRMFTDVLKGLSEENRKEAHANIGLSYCNRLFVLEREYEKAELNYEDRQKQRLEKSKPIAEEFFAWAKAIVNRTLPKSLFGKAITYAIHQEQYLMNVFLDGRLEISNNRAENSIRPFTVGRKNWLFCNTPSGAKASAAYYSLIETAKANHIDPCKYLEFLATKLSQKNGVDDSIMPWNFTDL